MASFVRFSLPYATGAITPKNAIAGTANLNCLPEPYRNFEVMAPVPEIPGCVEEKEWNPRGRLGVRKSGGEGDDRANSGLPCANPHTSQFLNLSDTPEILVICLGDLE